jgi:hypothetical protein
MKEKLLILGDSFAHTREELPDFSGKAWTKLLEEGNEYSVVNRAIGGSSLYYSYKEFNELHQEFDKVMLVITQAGRLYCPIIGDKLNTSGSHHTGTFWIDQNKDRIKKQQPHNIAAIKQLDAIRDYFLYIQDYSKDKEMNQLMLDEIKRRRPDTILVPAFQQSWTTLPQPTSWLDQIADMEIQHYGITYDDLRKKDGYADCRKCHMSERNNQIVYEKSLTWLKGAPVEFNLSDFEKPTEPREKYFPKRKDWEMRFVK